MMLLEMHSKKTSVFSCSGGFTEPTKMTVTTTTSNGGFLRGEESYHPHDTWVGTAYSNKYSDDENSSNEHSASINRLTSLVQCYSVSTGKVSTLLRSPSQSSISSIEVAEINQNFLPRISNDNNIVSDAGVSEHTNDYACISTHYNLSSYGEICKDNKINEDENISQTSLAMISPSVGYSANMHIYNR